MFKNIASFSVSPFFFASLALMVLVDSAGYMLIILVAVCLHELGHLYAMYRCGISVRRVRLIAFGVQITPKRQGLVPPAKTVLCAAAGPLANALPAILCFILSRFWLLPDRLLLFYAANLFLCLTNLLPLPPLDGGRILLCLLARLFGEYAAELIGAVLGLICGTAMLVLGVWALVSSGFNVSLCVMGTYLLVSMAFKIDEFRKTRKNNA